MCTVSAVGDGWTHQLPANWPDIYRQVPKGEPTIPLGVIPAIQPPVSREEFEALKLEMQELKKTLLKAKEIDIREGNPDCEMEDKIKILKAVAEAVGVDLSEVFGK